ncbi:MAG: hypothetical protein AB8B78_01870 [Polaribacter sp.]
MFPKKTPYLFICLFAIFSCVKDLDFEQIEDYTTSPAFSFSLAYFNITPNDFIAVSGGPNKTSVSQETEFKIFENKIIKNNLVKVDYTFEVNNEFNRDFTIEIELLDANGSLIKKLNDLKIVANTLNKPPTETITVASNPNIRNTERVRITIRLDDPTLPVNITDVGQFQFKSASTVYLETSLK